MSQPVTLPDGTSVVYVVARAPENLEVDSELPWSQWSAPETFNADLSDLNMAYSEEHQRFALRRGDETLGEFATAEDLTLLGSRAGFPAGFLMGLPHEWALQIMDHCMQNAPNQNLTIISDKGCIDNLLPGSRQFIPYQHTAQFAYNVLKDVYGEVKVGYAQANGKMTCRLLTPVQEPITRRVGDVLRQGVEIRQCYSTTTSVSCYAERLVCLNGMTRREEEFRWTQRSGQSLDSQYGWLRQGLQQVIEEFTNLVTRSREMANTRINGDPRQALQEHARAMGLPQRYWPALLAAFDEEPGDTEWDMLNAFTRLGTHNNLGSTSRNVQRAAGDWVGNFEMVTARLPRPMAQAVGAEILAASTS